MRKTVADMTREICERCRSDIAAETAENYPVEHIVEQALRLTQTNLFWGDYKRGDKTYRIEIKVRRVTQKGESVIFENIGD